MRIIVTGGRGFIGTHLVRRLVQQQHHVKVIDNISSACLPPVFGAEYHTNDIRKFHSMLPLFSDIDVVFHLAAEARIQISIEHPRLTSEVNILGTINVLEACRIHKVARIINSSTSAIYGLTNQFPTAETTKPDCLNPYASSKLAAEEMVRCYSNLYGIQSLNLRYFNVFGEDSPVTGPYSLVIGIFLRQRKNHESLTVVGAGDSKRDFTYVGDVVDANLKAMGCRIDMNGEPINIGSGNNISILDVAKTISDKITFIDPRPGEAKETLADISRAKKVLDWEPKVNLLDWLQRNNH